MTCREGGAEGNRTPAWLLCRQPPFHLATAPCSDTACRVVDPGRLELPISSVQARHFPSKLRAHNVMWVRGAESNRRSPGSQSGALPLSYREHMPDPCQGFEPRLADSESAVLPVGRTRNVLSAPGEIRTPDLPGRSRPLYPLNYGRKGCGRGTRTLDLVVMGHPLTPLSYPALCSMVSKARLELARPLRADRLSTCRVYHCATST